ncbi:unnamed protein product [Urochloa decumbens]|uniref:Uncharacterized protein n=1 Tax=Urochloa decumbens TaxID=240449 RepID=A0ABC9CAG4_9POAL
MAALRPCPSGLVVGRSQLSFSTLSPRVLQPFGSASSLLISLNTSTGKTGHRHAIGAHYHKGAEEGPGLDPEDKKRVIEKQLKEYRELFAKYYELEKDMPFREDIEKIDEYDNAMSSRNTSIFHIEATTFSLYFCMIATKGVKLASRVMESAALRLDKQKEISSCTTKQTLAMYVSIFVKLVEEAHDKKFNDESIFSLLGAFRGVAVVGQIMLQDALANVNYVGYYSPNYNLVQKVDDTWRQFDQKMNNLEEKFRAVSKSAKAYEILRPTMTDAMIHTVFFISAMVGWHEGVLGYVPGTKGRKRSIRASDGGEPDVLGTSSGSM